MLVGCHDDDDGACRLDDGGGTMGGGTMGGGTMGVGRTELERRE